MIDPKLITEYRVSAYSAVTQDGDMEFDDPGGIATRLRQIADSVESGKLITATIRLDDDLIIYRICHD